VAYRQPITRPEIEQLRGVDSGGVIDTLLERRLVRVAGRKDAPGRPMVYSTTSEFLEVFSLKDLSSLPDLEEFRALQPPEEVAVIEAVEGEAGESQPEPSAAPQDSTSTAQDAPGASDADRPDDSSSHD
jgi:segregation and condensation protein B